MEGKTLKGLVEWLGDYGISANSLARICGINPGQMRQYMADIKRPSQKTLNKINEGTARFAATLTDYQI